MSTLMLISEVPMRFFARSSSWTPSAGRRSLSSYVRTPSPSNVNERVSPTAMGDGGGEVAAAPAASAAAQTSVTLPSSHTTERN
eukprot:4586010-Pleurochrysis_carterae.AAC.1